MNSTRRHATQIHFKEVLLLKRTNATLLERKQSFVHILNHLISHDTIVISHVSLTDHCLPCREDKSLISRATWEENSIERFELNC